MGFPLSKGSLDYGLLTCHWHHARFDLRSGCTFDLWADDTPVFEVRVEGDDIWVSNVPVQRADALFHFARLHRGLEENIGLVQAKNIVALLAEGGGGEKCNTGDREVRCATSSSVGRWDDHVEPGGSTGSLPWRDHAGLRFGCSGAHGCSKLCRTADATLSRTPQWRRLRRGAPERMDVPLGKGSPR